METLVAKYAMAPGNGHLYPILSLFVVAQSQSTTRRYSTLSESPDAPVVVSKRLFESCQFSSNFVTLNLLVCGVRMLEKSVP